MKYISNQLVREEPESYWIPPITFRVAESFEDFVALNPDLMVEQNGVRLGWLIDPYERQAYIFCPNREMETLAEPVSLSGVDVLPGFILDLSPI